MDDPDPARRSNYIPVKFTPGLNPFYCALPYNDKAREGHRPEAPSVVPWFEEEAPGTGRVAYLQRPMDNAIRDGPSNRVCAMGRRRTPVFALIIGNNVFRESNVRSLISTKAPASMFRQPYAITSG